MTSSAVPTAARSGPRGRWLATLAALLVALAACTGEPDPRGELEAAVAATGEASVTFQATVVGDPAAVDRLDGGLADAVLLVEGGEVGGARDPDGALRVALGLGGSEPALEVVSLPGGPLLLRSGLAAALGVDDGDPRAQLDPALEALGVDEAGREALAVSFAGGWLELTDVDDLEGALAAVGEGGVEDPADGPAEPFDLSALLDALTIGEVRDAGEVRRFEVTVDPTRLGPLAAGVTAARPGQVVLRDGLLQELRLEVADTEAGPVELVVTLTPVAEGRAVLRPEPDASVTAGQLRELVETLQRAGAVPGGG